MKVWTRLAEWIAQDGRAALITLSGVDGSSPREAQTHMVVRLNGDFHGTIGGGALEWSALTETRAALGANELAGRLHRQALGPELGQCCGGSVTLRIETFGGDDLSWIAPLSEREAEPPLRTVARQDNSGRLVRVPADTDNHVSGNAVAEHFGIARSPLYLFGAGHVGRALVLALAPLPFTIHWIDSRADAFPARVPANVRIMAALDPPATLDIAPPGAMVAVMTHSHPLDLAIVAKALALRDIAYVGLIGSRTKRARFLRQLAASGLAEGQRARLTCPIGGRRLADKSPAAIALTCALELMEVREQLSTGGNHAPSV